jgi:S1-C subfamily serine protease
VLAALIAAGVLAAPSVAALAVTSHDARAATPSTAQIKAVTIAATKKTTSPSGKTTASSKPATASSANTAAVDAAVVDTATEHAFAVAGPSVVYVNNVGVGSGSGVIYDAAGDIVTNEHVVANATQLSVTLSNGKTYSARLLGTDTADDLAVIRINATGTTAAHFVTTGNYTVASMVLAVGSPLGLQLSVTSGVISAINRTVQEPNGAYLPNAIQTSAPINPGNSGGALVNLSGAVVGIPTLEATDPQNNAGGAAQGIGFAIPSTRVLYIVHQIIATGKVAHTGRAYLGVAATDATQAGIQGLGGFTPGASTPISGALVQTVAPGSPADTAGLQPGDVITKINSTPITDQSDLLVALANLKPGQKITITVSRQGATLTLHATLGELSATR